MFGKTEQPYRRYNMPSKSKKQEKFMNAIAHNKDFSKKVGVSQKVAKEIIKPSKKKK